MVSVVECTGLWEGGLGKKKKDYIFGILHNFSFGHSGYLNNPMQYIILLLLFFTTTTTNVFTGRRPANNRIFPSSLAHLGA